MSNPSKQSLQDSGWVEVNPGHFVKRSGNKLKAVATDAAPVEFGSGGGMSSMASPADPGLLPAAAPSDFKFTISPSTDEQKLNKTEKAYLAHLRGMPGVSEIGVQDVTLKLGDDCRFTPDFRYLTADGGLVMVDVKGFQRDDALVKIKVAARQFPMFRFLIVKKIAVGWEETQIKP